MNINDLNLKRNSFITLLSSRRSGKSYLIGDLTHYFLSNPQNKIDVIYMFSNTAGIDESDTFEWMDKTCILSAGITNINNTIQNLMGLQLATKKKKHILLIFDDIDLDKQITGINILAVRGRHYNITTILSAQIASYAISTTIKNNTTYLFYRRLNSKAIKEQIFSIVNAFEKPQDLYRFTMDNIHDYQFLFYNNDSDDTGLKIIKANKYNFQYKMKRKKKNTNEFKRKPGDVTKLNVSEGHHIHNFLK